MAKNLTCCIKSLWAAMFGSVPVMSIPFYSVLTLIQRHVTVERLWNCTNVDCVDYECRGQFFCYCAQSNILFLTLKLLSNSSRRYSVIIIIIISEKIDLVLHMTDDSREISSLIFSKKYIKDN